jgi:hypothetical protein
MLLKLELKNNNSSIAKAKRILLFEKNLKKFQF